MLQQNNFLFSSVSIVPLPFYSIDGMENFLALLFVIKENVVIALTVKEAQFFFCVTWIKKNTTIE